MQIGLDVRSTARERERFYKLLLAQSKANGEVILAVNLEPLLTVAVKSSDQEEIMSMRSHQAS